MWCCVMMASCPVSDSTVQNDFPVTTHLSVLDNRVISHRINRAGLYCNMLNEESNGSETYAEDAMTQPLPMGLRWWAYLCGTNPR